MTVSHSSLLVGSSGKSKNSVRSGKSGNSSGKSGKSSGVKSGVPSGKIGKLPKSTVNKATRRAIDFADLAIGVHRDECIDPMSG